MSTGVDRAGLAVGIIVLAFIAYELAGASSLFPDLHTVSYLAYHRTWLKWTLFVLPPAVYMIWWLWHMSHTIPK